MLAKSRPMPVPLSTFDLSLGFVSGVKHASSPLLSPQCSNDDDVERVNPFLDVFEETLDKLKRENFNPTKRNEIWTLNKLN